jgi:hypothetical protein
VRYERACPLPHQARLIEISSTNRTKTSQFTSLASRYRLGTANSGGLDKCRTSWIRPDKHPHSPVTSARSRAHSERRLPPQGRGSRALGVRTRVWSRSEAVQMIQALTGRRMRRRRFERAWWRGSRGTPTGRSCRGGRGRKREVGRDCRGWSGASRALSLRGTDIVRRCGRTLAWSNQSEARGAGSHRAGG